MARWQTWCALAHDHTLKPQELGTYTVLCVVKTYSIHAVVFGKVVEGMALVRKAEAVGTQSGKPRQPVTVADCGEVCPDAGCLCLPLCLS